MFGNRYLRSRSIKRSLLKFLWSNYFIRFTTFTSLNAHSGFTILIIIVNHSWIWSEYRIESMIVLSILSGWIFEENMKLFFFQQFENMLEWREGQYEWLVKELVTIEINRNIVQYFSRYSRFRWHAQTPADCVLFFFFLNRTLIFNPLMSFT